MPIPFLAAAGIAIGGAIAGAVTDKAVDWAAEEMTDDDEEQQEQSADSGGENSIMDALGSWGPLGAVAGLLVAAIQALADADDQSRGDVRYAGRDMSLNGPANTPERKPDVHYVGNELGHGAMIPDGFSPVTAAYSGDDKGLALQEAQVQTL
ncbi:hypothetical protein FZ103_17430 [Streptomonospora sp. PA3]|uniref:hypothetical protein n=1 Tax=Streptomonospora sp. PA3 TaxID=2607326 RepID=UPI0012DBE6A8|nr:hypothetical protein [Streptomonospora sp. PA3]MUL42927.1 hypothetical protein [Streptomonospora sp. PA3]